MFACDVKATNFLARAIGTVLFYVVLIAVVGPGLAWDINIEKRGIARNRITVGVACESMPAHRLKSNSSGQYTGYG